MHAMKKILLTTLVLTALAAPSLAMQKAFYLLRSTSPGRITPFQTSLDILKQQAKSIDILIPQAYRIDSQGELAGFVDPVTLEVSRKNGVKVMALVTNVGFNKEKAQVFLSNPESQQKAITALLKACRDHQFYGVQFDFENIPLTSRDTLTRFYAKATRVLHDNGFQVSYAVVPVMTSQPAPTAYLNRKYQNWGGAYDLKALGQMGDFVSIMTYDQHEGGTTPGPTAGISYVEAAIKYSLQFMPPEKLSLGIPTYSGHWYTSAKKSGESTKINVHLSEISHRQVVDLLQKNKIKPHWDEQDQLNYAMYIHHWLKEYIFIEDRDSFKAKLSLAKKYKLHGISVFDVGNEDPRIWDVVKRS
jgi:spore germination protein YaaH